MRSMACTFCTQVCARKRARNSAFMRTMSAVFFASMCMTAL